MPALFRICLRRVYTHPVDHSRCVHWHGVGKHCQRTNAYAYTHNNSYVGLKRAYFPHVPFSFRSLNGRSHRDFDSTYTFLPQLFFGVVTSPTVSPSFFYQVILSGRQPRTAALFTLCYGDGGIGSPDQHFDDTLYICRAFPASVIIKMNTGILNENA